MNRVKDISFSIDKKKLLIGCHQEDDLIKEWFLIPISKHSSLNLSTAHERIYIYLKFKNKEDVQRHDIDTKFPIEVVNSIFEHIHPNKAKKRNALKY